MQREAFLWVSAVEILTILTACVSKKVLKMELLLFFSFCLSHARGQVCRGMGRLVMPCAQSPSSAVFESR
jgi:hypothetical protein